MDELKKGAESLGVELSDSALGMFQKYYELLEEKNRVMNLTAISGKRDIVQMHFLDSLCLMNVADFKNSSVIDVGTGAGFPGLPLKIAEPTISAVLLDATQKRVDFLKEVCDECKIDGVECLHARAEDAAGASNLREKFDFAVSRAVAQMNVLCELCMPFVKIGGAFVAMKSTASEEELANAQNAVITLGGCVESVHDYVIPGTEVSHRAVVVRKITETPPKYPRRYAKMTGKPL